MKHLKKLYPVAVAAVALMTLAAPASATTLTSPSGTVAPTGTEIHAESQGHVVFDTAIGKIECGSTFQGKTANENAASITAVIEALSFSNCTTAPLHVLKAGTLAITSTGGGQGSLTWTAAELTQETFGLHCIFSTNNTALGTLTSSTEPKPGNFADATLDISARIPRSGGRSGSFCGASTPWTGSYRFTTPTPLFID